MDNETKVISMKNVDMCIRYKAQQRAEHSKLCMSCALEILILAKALDIK